MAMEMSWSVFSEFVGEPGGFWPLYFNFFFFFLKRESYNSLIILARILSYPSMLFIS